MKILIYFVCVTLIALYSCTSLNMVVPGKTEECLFMSRELNDRMVVDLQVVSGVTYLAFMLKTPQLALIVREEYMSQMGINETVHIPGDYGFCFQNRHRKDGVVSITYDFHVDDKVFADARKQIAQDKHDYLLKILEQNKPRILPRGSDQSKFLEIAPSPVFNTKIEYKNDTLMEVQRKLISISLNADRLTTIISRRTKNMMQQTFIQTDTLNYVNRFSTVLCAGIVVIGFAQVKLLKNLFKE